MALDLKPVYLLSGSDAPKLDRALRRLRARFGDDSIERLEAPADTATDAVAACNAMGLFAAGGRLVLVEGVDRWKAPDAAAIAEYLKGPAPDTVLALVGKELKRESALAKACAKAGELLFYDVAKRELPRWAAEQFARLGAHADGEACRAIVELVGDDLQELESEIEKVAVWAGGEQIAVHDVEQLVAALGDVPPFRLTDAWGRRDLAGVLGAAEALLERSAPRAREVPALVGRLAGHVRRVRSCATLDAQGIRPRDAAAQLKMHPFAAENVFRQSRNFSAEELADALVSLAQLDGDLKGGSRLPAELLLERTLVAITAAR